MALKLRDDPDLQVLHFADDQALAHLVRHLTRSETGQARAAQSLLSEPRFKKAGQEYSKVWDLIGAELQHYGGDTLVNLVRRKGVTYREILRDVCKSMWLHVDETKSTAQIEEDLLASLHQVLWMETMQKHGKTISFPVEVPSEFSGDIEQLVRDDLSAALGLGKRMQSYISVLRIAVLFGELKRQSLTTLVNGQTAKLVSDALYGSALLDVSGPDFEVTTPAIFFIAYLRRSLNQDFY